MPTCPVRVEEDEDIGDRGDEGVVIDDVGEVGHSFVAFVCWGVERSGGVVGNVDRGGYVMSYGEGGEPGCRIGLNSGGNDVNLS